MSLNSSKSVRFSIISPMENSISHSVILHRPFKPPPKAGLSSTSTISSTSNTTPTSITPRNNIDFRIPRLTPVPTPERTTRLLGCQLPTMKRLALLESEQPLAQPLLGRPRCISPLPNMPTPTLRRSSSLGAFLVDHADLNSMCKNTNMFFAGEKAKHIPPKEIQFNRLRVLSPGPYETWYDFSLDKNCFKAAQASKKMASDFLVSEVERWDQETHH